MIEVEKQIRNSFLLFLTATIWGTAFVAQSVGMERVEPLTFNAVRCLIGGLFLLPCMALLNHLFPQRKQALASQLHYPSLRHSALFGGMICGLLFTLASNLQAYGVKYTTVGKAGFITSSYIVIVPLLGLFMKKKVRLRIWMAVAIAMSGLYLLCMGEQLTLALGDLLVFLSAILFSLHILAIDHFAARVDGVLLSCMQFMICGILTLIAAFLFENSDIEALLAAAFPLFYAGIMSCGVAYTLQIVGQKDMNPTVAALILSLESCISVIAGWIFLHEVLSTKEMIGCLLMFVAIVIAQLPQRKSVKESDGISKKYSSLSNME